MFFSGSYLPGSVEVTENRINERSLFRRFLPYGVNLYFIEIIGIMFILSAVAGKVVAVSMGIIMGIFLTWHIIGLQQGNDKNRVIQLYIMDLHVAFSLVFLIRFFISPGTPVNVDVFFVIFRSIMILIEVPAFFALSRS